MRTIATGAALALACLLAPAARAQDGPTPTARYKALVAEYETAQKEFNELRGKAASDAERKLAETKYPKTEAFAPRFRELADRYPDDPAALDCLLWEVRNARSSDQALFDALAKHLDSDKLRGACSALQYNHGEGVETFLRLVLDKSPHHDVRGQACYTLAKVLAGRAEIARQLHDGADEKRTAGLEGSYGVGAIARLRAADPAALAHEGEQLLEQVAKDFADVKQGRSTLGDAATGDLFELRNLAVGKQAPEIEGEDVDGVKFKLSDYRGQVVFLDFWGFW